MSVKVVKLAVLGLGNMGQNHLRVLSMLKNVDIAGIYDMDYEKASALAKIADTKAFSSIESLYAEALDAVVICTPTSTHADYIEQASNYVSNIFIEKPMAATLQEASHICDLARQKNLNLQVGFIERFNPAVQQLKRVLDASGNVINLDFVRTNKLSARITDVDVISDLMVHDIDLALYLNGPIRSMSAQGTTDGRLVNFASAILTHKNGKFSRIIASRITEKKIRRIEATCEDIFVDCELLRKEIVVSRQSEIHNKEEGYRVSSRQDNIEVKPQEALLLELQSFIESCLGRPSAMNANADDGLNAAQICQQIQDEIYGNS